MQTLHQDNKMVTAVKVLLPTGCISQFIEGIDSLKEKKWKKLQCCHRLPAISSCVTPQCRVLYLVIPCLPGVFFEKSLQTAFIYFLLQPTFFYTLEQQKCFLHHSKHASYKMLRWMLLNYICMFCVRHVCIFQIQFVINLL